MARITEMTFPGATGAELAGDDSVKAAYLGGDI